MTDNRISAEQDNRLAEKLKEIENLKTELDKYHNYLEDLVRERTLQLEEANKQLHKEINELKAAENELWQLNLELNQIFNISIPICLINEDFRIIHFNNTFCDFFEISEEEIYQKRCYEIRRGPFCQTEKCTLRRLSKENIDIVYEHQFRTKKGLLKHYLISAKPYINSDGEFLGIVENFTDLTEQKYLLTEKERLLKAIEISKEAIHLTTPDGIITYANQAMDELFGYAKDELIGMHISNLNAGSPHMVQQLAETILNTIDKGGEWEGEILNKRKNGTEFFSHAKISALFDFQGSVLTYISTLHDITDRKNSERMNSQLAAIVENSNDAIISKTLDGIILSWNKASKQIYGYSEEEVIGKSIKLLYPPDYYDEFVEIMEKIRKGEQVEHLETVRIRKDGKKIPCAITISPIKDKNGAIVGASTIARDISIRKKAEEKLRESEFNLKERVKELTCLYVISKLVENLDNSIAEVLSNSLKIIPTAFQFPEIICLRIKYGTDTFQTPVFKESERKITFNQIIDEKQFTIEIFYVDEQLFLAEEKNLITEIGKRLITFIHQKLAAESLALSENRYRQLFEEAPIALKEENFSEVKSYLNSLKSQGITDFRAHFNQYPDDIQKCAMLVKGLNVNKVYLNLYQANDKDEFQLGLQNIFTEDSYNTFKEELITFTEGKTSFQAETITKTLQGSEIFVHMMINIAPGHEDDLSRVLVTIRDITERIKLKNLRKVFATTVSHELRTPISILSQSVRNLRRYMENLSKEQIDKLLESLQRNTDILTDLIEDVLLLSRYDDQAIKTEFKPYYPLEILLTVLEQFKARLEEKDISLEYAIDYQIQLFGDMKKIQQLFRIFLDNSIKYSKNKSKIKISAVDYYKGKYNPTGINGVLIQFSDTGVGINTEDIPYVFEQFYRSKDVSAIPGTGLGLYLAREIAKMHKGSIYVESTYGRGTDFFLFLPRLKKL